MKKILVYVIVAAVAVAVCALVLSRVFGSCNVPRISTDKAGAGQHFTAEKFDRIDEETWEPSVLDFLPHEESDAERLLKDLPPGSEVIHTSHGDIVRSPEGEYYTPKEGQDGELKPFEGEVTVKKRKVPSLALELKPFGGIGINTRGHPVIVGGVTLLRIKDRAAVGGYASLDTAGGQVGAGIAAAVPVVWHLNVAAGAGVDFAEFEDGSFREMEQKEFTAFVGVVIR